MCRSFDKIQLQKLDSWIHACTHRQVDLPLFIDNHVYFSFSEIDGKGFKLEKTAG